VWTISFKYTEIYISILNKAFSIKVLRRNLSKQAFQHFFEID